MTMPTLRHNGSPAGHAFAEAWKWARLEGDAYTDNWIYDLRAAGVKAARYDDGWVDRQRNEVLISPYAHFNDGAGVGDTVALGSYTMYRLVRLTHMARRMFSSNEPWWGFVLVGGGTAPDAKPRPT
jgi:hypothetical protein